MDLIAVRVAEDELYPYYVLDCEGWGRIMELPKEVVEGYKKAERKYEIARKLLRAAIDSWYDRRPE